jgi:hypothetical protein
MRHTRLFVILLGVALLACAGTALAQTPALQGTVTLRGGKVLTGEIKVAQVGVLQGSGIGTLLPDMGTFKLKVGDQTQEIAAADLASVEIQWGLLNAQDPQSWEIQQISIVKRDGTQVTGQPTWGLQATSVVVDDQPALYAFPKGEGFSADNLLTRIEIAGATPALISPPAATPPALISPPTATPPAAFPPATVPPATPPAPAVPPATPPPATVTVTPLPAAPPATMTPAPPGPVVTATETAINVTVNALPTRAMGTTDLRLRFTCPKCGQLMEATVLSCPVGKPFDFTVICPRCGEKITIHLQLDAWPPVPTSPPPSAPTTPPPAAPPAG